MKKATITVCLLLCVSLAYSQKVKSISFMVYNESTALPFTRLLPINPGGEIGICLVEKITDKSIINWNLGLGGFYHKNIVNAFYLKGEFQYRPIIKSLFTFDLIGNIGYMHTFYPGEVYELNEKTGDLEKITQFGRPHVLAGLGMGVTYIRSKKVHPFIRQEFLIESPFANGIPAMAHSFLKIGVLCSLNTK